MNKEELIKIIDDYGNLEEIGDEEDYGFSKFTQQTLDNSKMFVDKYSEIIIEMSSTYGNSGLFKLNTKNNQYELFVLIGETHFSWAYISKDLNDYKEVDHIPINFDDVDLIIKEYCL